MQTMAAVGYRFANDGSSSRTFSLTWARGRAISMRLIVSTTMETMSQAMCVGWMTGALKHAIGANKKTQVVNIAALTGGITKRGARALRSMGRFAISGYMTARKPQPAPMMPPHIFTVVII